MPSSNGDDFQGFMNFPSETDIDQAPAEEAEADMPELEVGPRAERPNFLTATRFVDFDLPPEIMEGLDSAGFEYCTPIQAQAIPVAMKGLDIAGQAQTGTGKTTAFLVPMLNRLLKNKPLEPGMPRAIIVTPTRELALQIYEDAKVLARNTDLKQVLVIGGMEYREQADILRSAPEIVICTPGRVIDYIQQGVFKTRGIEVAVVDEADRLLDMGFIKDLKIILGKLPPFTVRQTMLFSATLDERVLELTYQYMNPPQYITAEPDKSTKVNIEQELYHIGRDEKLSLLLGLLRREEHRRVIIFCNTKSGVEWLSKKLTMNGFQAEGITGDLPQPKRLKLMEAFKENRLQILVATDVASRGIHVDDVSHVYNYDLPQDAENYIHRIGRTARAGNSGKAVSFGCEDYVFHLEAIENLLGEKIPVFWPETEWFQADQGGEVRLKDRRGDRDRDKRRSGEGRGRGEGRGEGAHPSSRGPAKSQRPGGIFGLAPRLSSGNGQDGARQTLEWVLEDAPLIEAEILEISVSETAQESPEKEGQAGRRRKRRRNKRGRDNAALEARGQVQEDTAQKPETESAPQTAEAAAQESAAAMAEPKKPARKPRRQSPLKAAPAGALAETLAAEAAPEPEKPARARGGRTKAAARPAAPEQDRYPKKRVSAPVTAETETPKTVAAEAAVAEETPKYLSRRVAMEEKLEASQPMAEEKPRRGRPRKAAEQAPIEKPRKAATSRTTVAKKAAADPGAATEAAPVKAPRKAPVKKTPVAPTAVTEEKAPTPAAVKKIAVKKEAAPKKASAPTDEGKTVKKAVPPKNAPVKKTAAPKPAAAKAAAKKTPEAPKAKAPAKAKEPAQKPTSRKKAE